jgi:hypothetical protein
MEGDPPEREVVEGGGIDVLLEINDSNKCHCLSSSIESPPVVNDDQAEAIGMDVHPNIHGFVDEDLLAAADVNIAADNVQDAAVDVDLLADVDVVLAVNNVQDFEATTAPVDGDQVEDVDDDQVDDVKFVKKMPKRMKIYRRSEKRGGARKLGDGGEGIEYIPPVAPTRFAVALEPDTRVTPITPSNQIKYILKKILFCQLQQMEVNIAILVVL